MFAGLRRARNLHKRYFAGVRQAPITASAMEYLRDLLFASDATLLALTGVGLLALAGFASLMERRRSKARSLDRLERVGWMPWTTVFVLCAIAGMGMLAMSAPVVLGNL